MTTSIDYGNGMTNIDHESGIRFGVIHTNDLSPDALSDVYDNGEDRDFEEHKDALKTTLTSAIEEALEEYGHNRSNSAEDLAEEIVDGLEWDNYEGTGGCQRMNYEDEKEGYKLQTDGDGDLWVIRSNFYTYAPFCSPCAPGAGYLGNGCYDESLPKVYCLDEAWFSTEYPCPYPVFRVSDNCPKYLPADTLEEEGDE